MWGAITICFGHPNIFDMPVPHFGLPFGTWYPAILCPAYECGILLLPLLVRSSKNIEVPDPAVGFKDSCIPFCGSQLSKVATENQMLLAVFCTRLYNQNYFP